MRIETLHHDCVKLAQCPDGCCMACLHCIGARVANLMSLFGDDWLGALCCLSGHANAVSDCARGVCGHAEHAVSEVTR